MDLKWDHRVCVAAARFLAGKLDQDPASVRVLDVPEHTRAPSQDHQVVDLVAKVGRLKVAFEHTVVESYPNQIGDGKRVGKFHRMVESSLSQPLPPGIFNLAFHTDAVSKMKRRQRKKAAGLVADWIDTSAPHLAMEDPNHQGRRSWRTDEPLELSLWYRPSRQSLFHFSRVVPDDLDSLLKNVLTRAFHNKLPKLAESRELGCQTCLVLESPDISLTSQEHIAAAGREALEGLTNLEPDWIILAEPIDRVTFWSLLFGSEEWTAPDTWQDDAIPIEDHMTVELPDDLNG